MSQAHQGLHLRSIIWDGWFPSISQILEAACSVASRVQVPPLFLSFLFLLPSVQLGLVNSLKLEEQCSVFTLLSFLSLQGTGFMRSAIKGNCVQVAVLSVLVWSLLWSPCVTCISNTGFHSRVHMSSLATVKGFLTTQSPNLGNPAPVDSLVLSLLTCSDHLGHTHSPQLMQNSFLAGSRPKQHPILLTRPRENQSYQKHNWNS